MTAAPDRRQTKTRAALHNAFRSLLRGQGYDELTVGAVAETANVGRSTFYEHYRTMDDLLRASIQARAGVRAGTADCRPAARHATGRAADSRRRHRPPDRRDAAGPDRRLDRRPPRDAAGSRGERAGRRYGCTDECLGGQGALANVRFAIRLLRCLTD
ncbi:TetR family transcriptional regulator [Pseudoduganella sp. FT26W]|uniref:TetR family transcriptional regulator n=1 Tax=Duganella aquatilis TaxID=2666082 RepID=A0A844D9N3_9BURK|nr:TetR family transcriptional regulator [Duganella aquatilis]